MKLSMKILFTGLFFSLIACSSNRRVETIETRTITPNGSQTTEITNNVDTSDNDSCGGALSCTVDFLGEVIAFPFRLVGGAAEAIF